MKIIFVVSALHGGGAERVVATLANCFAGQGEDVTVLMAAGKEQAYALREEVRAVSIGQASGGDPLIQLKRIFAMRSYFRQNPESILISFSTTINLFTILASLGLGNKVIVSERNDPNRCGYPWLRNLIYRLGKGFVFQTEDAKQCFSKKIRERSAVIPNPIRQRLPDAYEGSREKKIAAVGRLEPQKNYPLLLRAFCEFQKRFPEYELHIFGKGSLEKELRELAKELGIKEKVVFEGFRNDVLERIRAYAMYVLSSDYEGISNSLAEAMAIGLPCISTDCPIGGSALCIQDQENGFLIPTGDQAALCRQMEFVALAQQKENILAETKEGAVLRKIRRNGVNIRERFSEEAIVQKWRDFIEEG